MILPCMKSMNALWCEDFDLFFIKRVTFYFCRVFYDRMKYINIDALLGYDMHVLFPQYQVPRVLIFRNLDISF